MIRSNIKRIFFTIPIILVGIFCDAQQISLATEFWVEDDQFNKSQSIVPIYKYTSSKIEPYSKFGVEMDEDQEWYQIKKLPDMSEWKDTGYTYIYFAGADNERSQGYILALVSNYVRSLRDIEFWIDRNNDLDFTNDGPPVVVTYKMHEVTIELQNAEDTSAKYALKLSRFKYGENVKYKRLLDEHYKAHSGNKEFTSVNYCFREQRYNSVMAHYNNGVDSFSIGVKDMNVNGFYNDKEVDLWYVGIYGSIIDSDELREMQKKSADNTFEWNGKKYELKGVERNGDSIYIKELVDAEIVNTLKVGKKVPNFSYYNIFNVEHELKEFKKQGVYLFFWNTATLSDEDTMFLGMLHREFSPCLQVITLNHGDQPKMVKIAFHYDKLSFPIGYSNSDIADAYYLQDVPRGYYIGKKCKLIDEKISPKEMYQRLVENTSNP